MRTIDEIFPSNLRALEERVNRQRERVSELQRSGQDATNAKIVLDVMTESLVRLVEFHEKNCENARGDLSALEPVSTRAK
jgi:adenylate kinase